MRVLAVVGARPQFVKVAELVRACADRGVGCDLLHTGQHYDDALSRAFFNELDIPDPVANLAVGSGSHAVQTGEMMRRINRFLDDFSGRPDWVVVFGDTNSTLAAAIVVVKRGLPLAHVEAGLRSYDPTMPEEINRILTDRVSSLLFCPTRTAVDNLMKEGVRDGVHLTGDVMYDSVMRHKDYSLQRFEHPLGGQAFNLATIHRAENTDDRRRLANALACLAVSELPIVWPIHPRTSERITTYGLSLPSNITTTDPVGYFEMLALIQRSDRVITDSGGVQKEAFWLSTPCITLRATTEWPETLEGGWNRLVDTEVDRFLRAVNAEPDALSRSDTGHADAASTMIDTLCGGGGVKHH